MNYLNIYNNLIESRKNSKRQKKEGTYFEKHHIIPRCLGGCNEKSNLVLLTGREHFIAHWLLVKIYPDNVKLKWAFTGMLGERQKRKLNGKEIEKAKIIASDLFQKIAYDEKGYHRNSKVGKFTEEQKQEIVSIFKGTTLEKELIAKMYDVHWSTIMKILIEQGLKPKEIKSIACKKREYRHKLQLLTNDAKRLGPNKGKPRNKKALEAQRNSIKEYWKNVREGKIERIENNPISRPIRIIETGEVIKSKNFANNTYFVQEVSKKLINRSDPALIYHWEYVEKKKNS